MQDPLRTSDEHDLADAIATFRADPDMARFDTAEDIGGCWETAQRFAWHCSQLGAPYLFRKWKLPARYRTDYQHNVEVDGQIVCWTHRQMEPETPWPLVEPYADYRRRFGPPRPICVRCGARPHRRCGGVVRTMVEQIERHHARRARSRLARL